jgi:hypothetical protein
MEFKIPKLIRNSLIMGGVTMFASLAATGTPTLGNLYSGFIAGGLTALLELQHTYVRKEAVNKKANTSFFL